MVRLPENYKQSKEASVIIKNVDIDSTNGTVILSGWYDW